MCLGDASPTSLNPPSPEQVPALEGDVQSRRLMDTEVQLPMRATLDPPAQDHGIARHEVL